MTRRAVFIPYHPKTILNKHKRADLWFWTRYSAYPHIGCQHGCEFCYCRERKYAPYDDHPDFAYVIKVKENAPELLRRALARAAVDPRVIGRRLRELCAQHYVRDRIPRPIVPGDKRAVNKRLAERLADAAYALEVEGAPPSRVWATCKAAWAMDDLEQDIGLLYRTMGRKGIESIEGVGSAMGGEIESLLQAEHTGR